ncbi:MAG: hypothetical protein WAL25_02220 [Acidimicrobiia bacterium]
MTRLHWKEDDFEELLATAESLRGRVEVFDGRLSAEFAKTGKGKGMIIAAYRSESDYQEASAEVASILGELERLLTSTPHGHQGTVALSFGSSRT